jgi:hypothetical protein
LRASPYRLRKSQNALCKHSILFFPQTALLI